MLNVVNEIKNADKKKKRFLSLFTAAFMTFTTLGSSLSASADPASSIDGIQNVTGNEAMKAELLDVPDAEDKFLGIAGDFTIFVKDKFIIPLDSADIEGRVAAGGGIENERDTYDIGSRYNGKGASVITGGGKIEMILELPDKGRRFAVSSDTDVDADSYQKTIEKGDFFIADDLIDFDAEFSKIEKLSDEIAGYKATGTLLEQYGAYKLVGGNTELNVFTLTEEEWAQFSKSNYIQIILTRPIMESYVIINVPGKEKVDLPSYSVEFVQVEADTDGSPLLKDGQFVELDKRQAKQDSRNEDGTMEDDMLLCGHVLYNINEAVDVEYHNSLQGSVLAPNANVHSERIGHVSGSTISKSAEGFGIQAGSITFNPPKKVIVPEPEEPEKVSEITIKKTDVTGGPEIPGAVLVITAKDENADLSEVTSEAAKNFSAEENTVTFTSTDKKTVIKGLPDGNYTLTEITSPDGYTLNEETVPFTVTDGKVESTVEMVDAPSKLTVSKVDVTNEEELPGAVITLTLEKSTKTDNATLEKLVSGSIKSANENNTAITWTSTDKPVVLEGLPDGEYRLKEVNPPAGYEVTADVKFKITEGVLEKADSSVPGANDNVVDSSTGTVIMKDELAEVPKPESEISISKREITGGPELPGAKLTITLVKPADEDDALLNEVTVSGGAQDAVSGKTTVTFTSGSEETVVKGLPDGDYTLTETTSPDGYTINNETIEFSVKDGKLASGSEVEMLDKPSEISVSKMAVNGTSELPGAVLTLTLDKSSKTQAANLKAQLSDTVKAANDEVTAVTWTSASKPVVLTGLPDGEYTLDESVAPDGYTVTDSIKFTIEDGALKSDDEDVDSAKGTVVMRDELSEVAISKKAVDGTDELPGATLKITLVEGESDLLGVTVVSDGNPKITKDEIEFVSGTSETVVKSLPDGKYTLTEITSPDGYTLKEETIKFEVVNGRTTVGNNHVQMFDESSSVTISKADAAGDEIPGAVLTLELKKASKDSDATLENQLSDTVKSANADNTAITWTSSDKPLILKQLPDGDYVLSETVAPDRYTVTGSIEFTVENGKVKGTEDDKVQMVDELSSVSVSKREITGGPELPGAKLTVTLTEAAEEGASLSDVKVGGGAVSPAAASGKVVFTSGDKPAVIEGLPDGKYELTETTSPDGYTVNDETVSFEIENGVLKSGSEVEMLDKSSEITVSKVQAGGSSEVPGAVLTLTLTKATKNSSATLEDAVKKTAYVGVTLSETSDRTITWTSVKTPVELKGLPDGEYTLEESVAPDGYTVTDAVTFTIKDGAIAGSDDNKVVMADELSKVSVSKQTVAGDELPGAVLILKNDDGKSLEDVVTEADVTAKGNTVTWTSGKTPVVIEGIPDGEYTLTEDRAPLGYEVAESISFTVKSGVVQEFKGGKIVMTDYEEAKPSEVIISKTDLSGVTEVPGARLRITAADENVNLSDVKVSVKADSISSAVSWVSGTSPVTVTGLPDGKYILEESIAPDGYTVTDSITFELKDGMVVGSDNNRVVMKDAPSEIKISKQDINGTEEIPGAKLAVVLVNPESDDASLSDVKVAGGAVSPSAVSDRIVFTSGKTPAVIEGLPDGKYELTETRSPDGYTVNSETIPFEIKDGLLVTDDDSDTVVMTDTQSEVSVSKTNMAMSDEVPGAVLSLTLKQSYKDAAADLKAVAEGNKEVSIAEKSDDRQITWTSGKTPVVLKGLPDGEYVLEEMAAPDRYTKITGSISFIISDGKVESDTATAPKPNEGKIDSANSRVIMIDELSEVAVSKTDITGNEIPGAVLTLTNTDNKDLSEVASETKITVEKNKVSWVSEERTTVLRGLPDGSYTIEETQAPDGYLLTEKSEFTITNGIPSESKIVMKDAYSEVVIRKTDIEGAEVPGAKLTITVSENKTPLTDVKVSGGASEIVKTADSITFISGSEDTVISAVPDGKYVLTETQAPEGYEIAESVEFTVEGGKIKGSEDNTVTMVDEYTPVVTTVTTVTTPEETTVTTTEETTVTTEETTVTTTEETTVTTTEITTTEETTVVTTLPLPEFSVSNDGNLTGIPETDVTELETTVTTTEETTVTTTEVTTTEETTTEATTTEETTTETTTEATTTEATTTEETTTVTTTEEVTTTTPKITAQSVSSTPETGDTRSTAAVMLFMAGSAAAMMYVSKKKKD